MKNLILVLHCTARPGNAISYNYNKDTEVYVIYNFDLLSSYVEDLLKNISSDREVTVVVVYKEIDILLDALKLLHSLGSEERKQRYYDRFKQSYKRQLAAVSGNGLGNLDFEVRLPQGLGDLAFGFDTVFAYDVTGFGPSDHLREGNTGVQQLLRFLAVKHGAFYGAFSGPLVEFEEPDQCQLIVMSVKGELEKGKEQHIFSPKGEKITDQLTLHQSLPLSWDSWSKIQLVAKSIPRSSDWHLLDEEVKVEELNDAYEEYLKGDSDVFDSKAKLIVDYKEPPAPLELPAPLTYDDVIAGIEEAQQR